MSIEDLIQRATEEVHSNDYCTSAYRGLLSFIEASGMRPPVAYWRIKAHHDALSPEDIESWENTIDHEYPSELDNLREKATLYQMASSSLPIASYKTRYLHFYKQLLEFEVCTPSLTELATTFYNQHSRDFCHSQLIFQVLIESLGTDEKSIRRLYEERICIPHKQLADTFQTLSSLVSRQEPENYTRVMRRLSKTMSDTSRSQRYYERIEFDIASDNGNPTLWANYLEMVYKYDKSSLLLVFYNSLHYSGQFRKGDETWLPLWKFVVMALDESHEIAEKKTFLDLYLRMYPTRCEPYAELLYADILQFQSLKQRISEEKVGSSASLVKDVVTILVYLARSQNEGELDSKMILPYCRLLPNFGGMKFLLTLLSFSADISTTIASDYLENYRQNAEIWSLALETFVLHKKYDMANTLVHGWRENFLSYDKPELCLDAIQAYCGTAGLSLESLFSLHTALRRATEEIRSKKPSGTPEAPEFKRKLDPESDDESHLKAVCQSPELKKPKSHHESAVPQRSREQFRIKVSPVNDASEEDIKDFFKDCAIPLSILISPKYVPESFAIVELASEEDVLICLSRHLKPLQGCPVSIDRIFGNTVWMTNYPPQLSVDDIRSLVTEVSKHIPVSIRVPCQQDSSERRFCYIDFQDANSALRAANSLLSHEANGYKILAEVSNPSLRKPRNNKTPSLQIYLRNLNFKVSDSNSIRQFALKIGIVTSVDIPLSEANKEKGYKNNGYAFVTFNSEEAKERALSLQSANIDGRVVTISAVTTKANTHNHASHFDNLSTITIRGVDEHITVEHLRRFVEDKVGPVARIQLKPSTNMALIEFETVKDSGRAEFILQSTKLESRTLCVGPKKDFFATEHTISVPKMMPPSLMRRRKK